MTIGTVSVSLTLPVDTDGGTQKKEHDCADINEINEGIAGMGIKGASDDHNSSSPAAVNSSNDATSSHNSHSQSRTSNRHSVTSAGEEILKHTKVFYAEYGPYRVAGSTTKSKLSRYEPTTNDRWYDLNTDEGLIHRFEIQHGNLPRLEVRYLHDAWINQPDTNSELDAAIDWLMADCADNILGLDAEGGVTLIQISSKTRCLLLRVPDQKKNTQATKEMFSPKFRSLMRDPTILKVGAELWTDAIEVYAATHHSVITNGGVNISLAHRRGDGAGRSMGLGDICHDVLGPNAFRKDRGMTCSDWSAERLTLRQMVYAALDAQVGHALGANSKALPAAFHLSRIDPTLLERASVWRHQIRMEQKESANEVEVAYRDVTFSADKKVEVFMKQYVSRIRNGSNVTFHWKDGSQNSMRVEKVNGKRATVEFTGGGDAKSGLRKPEELEKVTLNRADEEEIFHQPAQELLSDIIQGSISGGSPFVHAMLGLNMADGNKWWFKPMCLNTDRSYENDSSFQPLNESQRSALRLTDRHRIVAIQGPPGTGKTRCIAAEAVRSLKRSSTIGDPSKPCQRVLILAETNTAARHVCEAVAKFLKSDQLQLLVSQEFEYEWHEKAYAQLRKDDYMKLCPLKERKRGRRKEGKTKEPSKAGPMPDPLVLVCTVGKAMNKAGGDVLFQNRQTLILDEASQIHDLKAMLVLNLLPHTERIILFGDQNQLAPFVAREEARSILDVANELELTRPSSSPAPALASSSSSPGTGRPTASRPLVLTSAVTMLDIQYRMPAHLGDLVSQIFYEGKLRSHKQEKTSAISWKDVDGWIQYDNTSAYCDQEIHAVEHLRRKFLTKYVASDIVVICLYEAQRKRLANLHPSWNVENVDSFQGQEAKVILLTLSADHPTKFVTDRRRVNVAISRAKERMVIIGNKVKLGKKESCWRRIIQYIDGSTDSSSSSSSPPLSLPSAKPTSAGTPSTDSTVTTAGGADLLRQVSNVIPLAGIRLLSLGNAIYKRLKQPWNDLSGGKWILRDFINSHAAEGHFTLSDIDSKHGPLIRVPPGKNQNTGTKQVKAPVTAKKASSVPVTVDGTKAAASSPPSPSSSASPPLSSSALVAALSVVLGDSGVHLFRLGNAVSATLGRDWKSMSGGESLSSFIRKHTADFNEDKVNDSNGPLITRKKTKEGQTASSSNTHAMQAKPSSATSSSTSAVAQTPESVLLAKVSSVIPSAGIRFHSLGNAIHHRFKGATLFTLSGVHRSLRKYIDSRAVAGDFLLSDMNHKQGPLITLVGRRDTHSDKEVNAGAGDARQSGKVYPHAETNESITTNKKSVFELILMVHDCLGHGIHLYHLGNAFSQRYGRPWSLFSGGASLRAFIEVSATAGYFRISQLDDRDGPFVSIGERALNQEDTLEGTTHALALQKKAIFKAERKKEKIATAPSNGVKL